MQAPNVFNMFNETLISAHAMLPCINIQGINIPRTRLVNLHSLVEKSCGNGRFTRY